MNNLDFVCQCPWTDWARFSPLVLLRPKRRRCHPATLCLCFLWCQRQQNSASQEKKPNAATASECLHWFCNTAFYRRRAWTCHGAELL